MKNRNSGYSTPSMLLIIFSLSLILGGAGVFARAAAGRIKTVQNDSENYSKAEEIANSMFEDFQCVKDDEADCKNAVYMMEFVSKYPSVTVKDVSTGINERILGSEFISNQSVKNLLAVSPELVSDYGWINTSVVSEKGKAVSVKEDVVSELPLMNIHCMDSDFIKAVLDVNKIPDSQNKTDKLFQLMQKQEINLESIAKTLNVSKDSMVMKYLGVKTCFWQISAVCGSYSIREVLGAVQDSKEKNKIKKYILIEKNIEKRTVNEKA